MVSSSKLFVIPPLKNATEIKSLAILCMHEAKIKAVQRYEPTNQEDDQRSDNQENHNNVIASCIAHSITTRIALKSSLL